MHPTEAVGQDGWISVQLGYSQSVALSLLLAASGGAVVSASSSTRPVGALVRAAGSSARGMLGLQSGVGVSMAGCSCAASSTLASGVLQVMCLKTSQSLKVV